MHLAGQEGKGDTYQIQPPTDTFGGPPSRLSPAPQRAVSAASTQTRRSAGRREGGTVPSGSHSISLVLPPLQASLQLWGAS